MDEAVVALGQEELEEAERLFTLASAQRPGAMEARYGLASVDARRCWTLGERCADCLEAFTEVLDDGGFRHARYNRATCLIQGGAHAEALADLDRAVVDSPEDPDYRATRGELLWSAGRKQEACADFLLAGDRANEALGARLEACSTLQETP